ncbi:MAG: hypothetical protein K6F53_05380, partial [Lachnospiraceae bacterium]|nr:hypothetical protein [Lachnospiraceae bacterium]
MNLKQSAYYEAVSENAVPILDEMESALRSLGVSEKVCKKTRFRAEDPLLELIRKSPDGARIKLVVTSFFKTISVRVSCRGDEFSYRENLEELFAGDIDEEAEAIVRTHLLKEYEKDI